ncbi:Zinc finger, FYVE/PHD-type [Sesbania bispinosa]|nr:Zinc finger, FYVE/PHD-type [Sesbania bispinosa]
MAKTRPGKKDLDSYTIRGTNKIVRGNRSKTLFLDLPSCANGFKIVPFEEGSEGNGSKSCGYCVDYRKVWLFFIFTFTFWQWRLCVDAPFRYKQATVRSARGKIEQDSRNNVKVRVRWYYRPEESIGGRRQFHGAKELFEYKAATGAFTPDRVAVYCKCEMPYNPDDLMVQCEGCKDCIRCVFAWTKEFVDIPATAEPT